MHELLKNNLAELFPAFRNLILLDDNIAKSTWNAPFHTGKALELVSFFFLIEEFKKNGAIINIPDIYQEKPYLFYLRNTLPRHHSAQAGHSISLNDDIPLNERFVSSCTPKAEISFKENSYYIMREGNPIHEFENAIKKDYYYKDRPDISIYSGNVFVKEEKHSINVLSKNNDASVTYKLAIKNTDNLPIQDYSETGCFNISTRGIIECSENKTSVAANTQIKKYGDIFRNKDNSLIAYLFINGADKKCKHDTINVNMNKLIDSFSTNSSSKILHQFVDSIDV